ncbi:MAG: M14 family zinc carboxypeptidase [Thermomicrobiales bacterium]
MDRNIHGDQVIEWCGRVAGPDTVAAWIEGESYQGRPIPALSLHSASPGRVWSPVKLSILKPTALIVARHHANEISSTNSALQLAHLVGTDAEWAELIEHLNIVAIPYENADGAALFMPGSQRRQGPKHGSIIPPATMRSDTSSARIFTPG